MAFLVVFLFILALITWLAWVGTGIYLVAVNVLAMDDIGINLWNLTWLIVGAVMIVSGIFTGNKS